MRETTAICFESLLSIVDGLRQPFNFRSLTFSSFTIVKLAAGCRPSANANLWRSQIWRFFFGRAPPLPSTEFANATLTREINFFKFGPPNSLTLPPPPQTSNFAGKCGSICQGPQLVEYSSNQTLSCVGVTKKKLSSFCLQRTTRITQEIEARNHNTSTKSEMKKRDNFGILEYMELES